MTLLHKFKRHHPAIFVAALLSIMLAAPIAFAGPITVTGGSMILSLDRQAWGSLNYGSTTSGLFDPSQYISGVVDPGMYLEEFFDLPTAAGVPGSQRGSYHVVPGVGEIDGSNLQFGVTGPTVVNLTGNHTQPTLFSYDPADPAGTASGAVGFGGLMRFRGTWAAPNYGASYISWGEFTLEYDPILAINGASGWALWNHVSFRAHSFDLFNVTTRVEANGLVLSGDLRFSDTTAGAFFSPDDIGKDLGDFRIQLTSVPLPGAVWLFALGVFGLTASARRKTAV